MREQIARDVWDKATEAWNSLTHEDIFASENAAIAVIQEALEKVAQAAIDASAEAALGEMHPHYVGGQDENGNLLPGSPYDRGVADAHKRVSALSAKSIVEGVK